MGWSEPETDKELSLEELKSIITPYELCDVLEITYDKQGKIYSPYHDENTPSCQLYGDHYYDFSIGQGGDIFDLTMLMTECNLAQAIHFLRKVAVQGDYEVSTVIKPGGSTREPINFTDEFVNTRVHAVRSDKHTDWAKTRWGFLPDSGEAVGCVDGFLVPHWYDNKVVGVKVRHWDGSKTSWLGSDFSHLYTPYGSLPPSRPAVLCEGESDCWAMRRHAAKPVAIYGLPAGASSWKDSFKEVLDKHPKIYVCVDNDRAGEMAYQKISSSTWGRYDRLVVPTLYNDVCQATKAGWRPFATTNEYTA